MFVDLIMLASTLMFLTSFNSTYNETNDGTYDPDKVDSISQLSELFGYSLNDYELSVLSNYIPEPQQINCGLLTFNAKFFAEQLYTDANTNGDGDAYRHLYWTFCLAKFAGVNFAYDFVYSHEMGTSESLSKTMDLHNDAIAIRLFEDWQVYFEQNYFSDNQKFQSLSRYAQHCVRYGELYDVWKIDQNTSSLVYSNGGYDHTSEFGIIGFKDNMSIWDFGFEEQYFFYVKSSTVSTLGSYDIYTQRLRTGFIEEEYIVMSSRRANAGSAYLALEFERPVYSISLDMCLWSSLEYLDDQYSSASLFVYDEVNNIYQRQYDLLNDISLQTDRANPDHYRFHFEHGINHIRFAVTSSAIGDRNKGRICLGDIEIYYLSDTYLNLL